MTKAELTRFLEVFSDDVEIFVELPWPLDAGAPRRPVLRTRCGEHHNVGAYKVPGHAWYKTGSGRDTTGAIVLRVDITPAPSKKRPQ